MTEKIRIGQIINTHGIRGGLKVRTFTDDPERFYDLDTLYVEEPGKKQQEFHEIEKIQIHKGFVILYLKGFENINDVEHYKNAYLFIDESLMKTLEEDTYFIRDLIGLKVYSEEEGYLGILKDVLRGGSNEVYVIRGEQYGEVMIPAVGEFIKIVDLEKGEMHVELIEGMIE